MLKVNLVFFDDLTDSEKKEQPNNGSGKEHASYIKITDCGKTLMVLSDSAEPEDATFTKDFKGVVDALETMYLRGIKDGKKIARKKVSN